MMYNSSHFISYAFDLKQFCFMRQIYMGGSSYAWKRSQFIKAYRLRRLIRKIAKKQAKKRFSLKNNYLYLGTYLWRRSPYHNNFFRLE